MTSFWWLPYRATAYSALGEKDKATADLKKALMLEPGNKQAKDDLATLSMTPEVSMPTYPPPHVSHHDLSFENPYILVQLFGGEMRVEADC